MNIKSGRDRGVAGNKNRNGSLIDNHVSVIGKVLSPPSFLGVTFRGVRGGEIPDVIKWVIRLVDWATAEGGDQGDVVPGVMVESVGFPT